MRKCSPGAPRSRVKPASEIFILLGDTATLLSLFSRYSTGLLDLHVDTPDFALGSSIASLCGEKASGHDEIYIKRAQCLDPQRNEKIRPTTHCFENKEEIYLPQMSEEIYDALKEAGVSEERARAAARTVTGILSDLTLLKWMLGVNLGVTITILFRVFS